MTGLRRSLPDCIVALRIFHAGGVAFFQHVTVDVLHQKIGREDTVDEVSPQVKVVEVILEQGWDLRVTFNTPTR